MTNKEIITQLEDIKCHCQEMYEAEIKNVDTSSSIWGKDVEALEMAIKALESQRWIPVSERLPEDEQEILFSTKTGRVYSGKYHDDDSANQWYSHRDECRAWNNVVTAWMPLPKPYKVESEK